MARTAIGLLLALVVITSSSAASASDPPEPARLHWYGGEVLATGGASLGLVALGLALDDETATPVVAVLGATGYALGAPLVHWAHGQIGRGFGSLGLNLGLPLVGGLVAGAVTSAVGSSNAAMSDFEVGFLFVGVPLGAVAAVLVDAFVLAWEPAPSGVALGLDLGPDRLGLALSGRF